jgi:hypothetical protein
MGQILLAAFRNPEKSDGALYELEHFGYQPVDIAMISAPEGYERRGSVVAKSAGVGAIVGAAVGAIAGALVAAGIFTALSDLFFVDAVLSGLRGAAASIINGSVSGLIVGAIVGAITGLFLPREPAADYQKIFDSEGTILGLPDRSDITAEARMIMDKHGAIHVRMMETKNLPFSSPSPQIQRLRDLRTQPGFGERRQDSFSGVHRSRGRERRKP